MSTIHMLKTAAGYFIPASEEDVEACKRFKIGAVVQFDAKQKRNYEFHKKWFSLVGFAFEQWSDGPMPEYKGERVQPNFDRFRRDVTILCGYSHPVVAVNGAVRVEADSISFSSMDQETFERLYSKTIDVILQKILAGKGYTEDQLRALVDRTLEYA